MAPQRPPRRPFPKSLPRVPEGCGARWRGGERRGGPY
ncbi:hypothetical protein E2C01_072783 [Portunus trituberculatus]|uniref:Uncharacterized protein n=1 Tax=Portunus trituberculatus TaxID=210409 RepID=A0A5B7I8T0_PORTR|nr:hypothetical protein [Portunus trituberculatus]